MMPDGGTDVSGHITGHVTGDSARAHRQCTPAGKA
jgi:hypothetical protein